MQIAHIYRRKLKVLPLVFLFLGVFISSCSQVETEFNYENLSGEWVMSAVELDEEFYKPSTGIFEFANDSLYIKDFQDKVLSSSVLKFKDDSLQVGDQVIAKDQFSITDGVLYFNRLLGVRMKETSAPLSKKELESRLYTSDWEHSKGLYQFKENKDLLFKKTEDSLYNKYCYDLRNYKNKWFLFKKGNQLDCNRDNQFVEQLFQWTDSSFVTYGLRDGAFQNIYYSSVEKEEKRFTKPNTFQLCNMYINKNNPLDRYYYKGTTYNGGLYAIRKIITEQYIVPADNTESGIFQVRFVVNCEGRAGMFESQSFDFDYKLKDFSAAIYDQLLSISKTLQDWIPGRNQAGEAIDTYKYLNYRIEDGKITRIYP